MVHSVVAVSKFVGRRDMMVMVPCTVSVVYCVLHTILGLSGEDLGVVLEVVELEGGGGGWISL